MDPTHKNVFSSESFLRELVRTNTKKNYVRTVLKSYIYHDLELACEDDCPYANPFLIMNTIKKDGVLYYTERTKNEMKKYGINYGDRVDSKYRDTFVYFSRNKDSLRWILLPNVLKDVAHKVVKDTETFLFGNGNNASDWFHWCNIGLYDNDDVVPFNMSMSSGYTYDGKGNVGQAGSGLVILS